MSEYLDDIKVMPGNDVLFQARVLAELATGTTVTNEGKAVAAADVSTITCTVYNRTAGTSASVTITSAAYITLADDNFWNPQNDSVGKNFHFNVPGSNFSAEDAVYIVTFTTVLTSGAGGSTIKFKYRVSTVQEDE